MGQWPFQFDSIDQGKDSTLVIYAEFHAVPVFLPESFEALGKIWGSYRTAAGMVCPVDPLRGGTGTVRAVYARYP